MKPKPAKNLRREHLLSICTPRFEDHAQTYSLVEEFLDEETYNKDLCAKLISVARGTTGASWNLRRLAVLMLEHQVLKIRAQSLSDFDFILTELNLKQQPGSKVELSSSLLKEGYTTTNFRRFIPEFRRKLQKLNRVHQKIDGWLTAEEAFRDFLEVSRSDCKLSLGRYLFTAHEVADKIIGQLRISDGAKDPDPVEAWLIQGEARRAIERLPDFEASILKRLYSSGRIYWVSDGVSSELNSLVEYPLTTVVLTIKPPGSNVEFEIKRAGRKGNYALDVVYERGGYAVAPSHRLDGGDMQWLLHHETRAAAKFSTVYRLVHSTETPIPTYISRSTVYAVPVDGHEVQTLMYFTDPNVFEEDFGRMRKAMAEGVAAFRAEGYVQLHEIPGDLGLTAQFISVVTPAQTIITGTSSFRLDKVSYYLCPKGPRYYFDPNSSYSNGDARRLIDTVLEEVLGVYAPPDVDYETHEQYVAAALRVRANRRRADAIFLELLEEIGTFWGTLIGIRAYSRGESFVSRNVGLRSVWEGGEWKVKIIFMDHDAMGILGPHDTDFYPADALYGLQLDETYLFGRNSIIGSVGHLRRIYQVRDDVYQQGRQAALAAAKKAYRKTRRKLLTDPKLRPLFHEHFLNRMDDWDELVRLFLRAKAKGSVNEAWKDKTRKVFDKKIPKWFDAHIKVIEDYAAFLERQSYLFMPSQRKSSQ